MDLKKLFNQNKNYEDFEENPPEFLPEIIQEETSSLDEVDTQQSEQSPVLRSSLREKNKRKKSFSSSEDSAERLFEEKEDYATLTKAQDFFAAPSNIEETDLKFSEIADLSLKILAKKNTATGKELALELRLSLHGLVDLVLSNLYDQKYIDVVKTSGLIGANKTYKLTTLGYQKVEDINKISSYVGPAPVSIRDYILAVENYPEINFSPDELGKAYQDLTVNKDVLEQIGPALLSGKSLFLYGPPGTGKTSIAQRITKCYGSTIKIPFAVNVDGSVIKFFDSFWHKPINPEKLKDQNFHEDNRWIEIARPCILVGPEFRVSSTHIQADSLGENLQFPNSIKANGGVFIIDDFGRQKEHPDILFNRWIVPLGQRSDILSLPKTGQQVMLPFRVFLVFSTNLEPKKIVDDAAIRRLGYKVLINYPEVEAYCQIFALEAEKARISWSDEILEYFIEKEYYKNSRPMRASDPKDILSRVIDIARFRGLNFPCNLSKELLDRACTLFFSEF